MTKVKIVGLLGLDAEEANQRDTVLAETPYDRADAAVPQRDAVAGLGGNVQLITRATFASRSSSSHSSHGPVRTCATSSCDRGKHSHAAVELT